MSEAFLMRRYGGGVVSRAFALIAVTYPADSACTASDGTHTLRAAGGSGKYFFAIPNAGTWTVTISDTAHGTSSRSVAITEEGQIERLVLSFNDALFDSGTGLEYWSVTDSSSAVINERIRLSSNLANSYARATAYTTAALDLHGKSSVEVLASTGYSGNLAHTGHAMLCAVAEDQDVTALLYTAAASVELAEGESRTTSLDISGLDSSKRYRIVLLAFGGYDTGAALEVSVTVKTVTLQ